MKLKKTKLTKILAKIDELIRNAKKFEKHFRKEIEKVHPEFRQSAINLVHYISLRTQDISDLQDDLGDLSISRLGKAESHVMASMLSIRNIILRLLNKKEKKDNKKVVSIKKGKKYISRHTSALLGKKIKGSRTRIMVTLPTDSAEDKYYISDLVKSGMNAARVNCAHDDTVVWKKMIDNIYAAKKKSGRNVKVCMDLGGPKLRTGSMIPGPKLIHLQPERNTYGKITNPADVVLVKKIDEDLPEEIIQIPLNEEFLEKLNPGDTLNFIDTRDKHRKLVVGNKTGNFLTAKCFDSSYLVTGTKLELDLNGEKITTEVGEMPPLEEKIILKEGDVLRLHKEDVHGEPAEYDEEGNMIKTAHISCTLNKVFDDVKLGELIVFDDGKIEGVIKEKNNDEMLVEISYAKEGGAKLKADKGINLPNSSLKVKGLTQKDRKDLEFVAKNADVVNMSFVNDEQDVMDLVDELNKLEAEQLGIILKIETKTGVKNLPKILLTAMQTYPIGVMIARGDLAIEIGWKNLAEVQEEILMLCEAAHIPIVWATQVLESMAKKGRPSRAEITDAAMADRAECVMLNKGPFIHETIKTLEEILQSAQQHQDKRAPLMRKLKLVDANIIENN